MAEKTGRKGFGEELELIRRYSELSDKYFAFLVEMYESGDKNDKKWACERLEKAYIKMIPQDITSGGEKMLFNIIQYGDPDTVPMDTGTAPAGDTEK